MVPQEVISTGLNNLANGSITAAGLAQSWAEQYRQVNPEYIVNLDFGAIIVFQLMVSKFCNRFNALPVIIGGTLLIALSFIVGGLATGIGFSGILIALSIIGFSFGEMIASPKSQEYVAAIAPKENSAMYMGYYFVSMSLGFLFGGLLSGWSYGYFARELNTPMLIWVIYAGIGVLTALALLLFKRNWLPKWQQNEAVA